MRSFSSGSPHVPRWYGRHARRRAARRRGAAGREGVSNRFLGGATASGYAIQLNALRLGLKDSGYIEGKNITIEYRWAEGDYDRLPELAAELIRLKVAVIITQGAPAALAAKRATRTIPIVMAIVGDPVETGIVTSLAHPGGNITGSSMIIVDLNAKRLELMRIIDPRLSRAGVLVNSDNPMTALIVRGMEERARALNVKMRAVEVRRIPEIDSALEAARTDMEALVVQDDGLFIANARRVASLALKNRLSSIGFREYCEAGGLAAYGVDFPHIWRGAAVLVDKILKGAKPADLPIEQAEKFEFVINLKTAKALALTIPPSLLARADQVIE